MLVLTRKVNQKIKIGENIEIVVLEVRGEQVRLGINAPRDMKVHREEVYELIAKHNLESTSTDPSDVPKS